MEYSINLLPEKDKQLKRDGKPAQPETLVEMTKPEDRVFQERVVRVGGVMEFFKRVFKRAPKLPKQAAPAKPPSVPPLPSAPTPPPAKVTRLETMADRLPTARPEAEKHTASVFARLFGSRGVPPPPPPAPAMPAKPERVPAPPPPPPPAPFAPAPSGLRKVPPPPAPPSSTDAAPLLGQGLNVNLVPEEYQPEASPRDRILAGVVVGSAVLLVALAGVGLFLYQRSLENKVQRVDDELQQAKHAAREYESVDLQDALVLRQRTSDVRMLLSQHVYWDAFFKKLEAVTLPSVAYANMSVDISGTVTLSATARSYNDVGDQLLTYQRATDFITDVTISTATLATPTTTGAAANVPPGQTVGDPDSVVTFSVSMHVLPTIFYR